MAVINPHWPYWYDALFAQLLTPLSADVLFTVGLLVVSASFPPRMQGLAGAVFNTSAQLGSSIGLTVLSVISTSVTKDSGVEDLQSPQALMEGYRASFWALFAFTAIAVIVGGLGLRKVGKVGDKRD
jgi:MFS family permease